MLYTVVLHPEAEKEYLTSFLWYEERSPGLGERFEQAVESEIQSIANIRFITRRRNRIIVRRL